MRKRLIRLALIVVVLVSVALVVKKYSDTYFSQVMAYKTVRHTKGTVIDKKHVGFASDQSSYVDDEGHISNLNDQRRRDGEYRIYYKIDNFDQIPERDRASVLAAELSRSKKYGSHFSVVSRKQLEMTMIGSTLDVVYQWRGDGNVEIVSVSTIPHQEKAPQ